MKRKIKYIFASVFILTVCSWCAKETIKEDVGNEVAEEDYSDFIENMEKENVDEQRDDSVSLRPAILDHKVDLDTDGVVSHIPNESIQQGMQQSFYLYQNNFLLVYPIYDIESQINRMHMKIISTEDGNVLQETAIESLGTTWIQICGDLIAVNELDTGIIRLYDELLQEKKKYKVEPGAVYLNPAATVAYQFLTTGGIRITDLATGNVSMLLNNSRDLYVSVCSGNTVSMTYIDTNTEFLSYAALHIDTGILEQMPVDIALYGVENANGTWLAGLMDEENQYVVGTATDLYRYELKPGEMPQLLANPDHILVTNILEGNTLQLSLYGKDGRFLSSCRIEDVYYTGEEPMWSENANGYFFLCMNQMGKDQLYFWDLSAPVSGEGLLLKTWEQQEQIPQHSLVSQEYYQKAEALSKEYNITIKIAEQCDTKSDIYNIKPELEGKYIDAGLDVLRTALGNYPKGFFEQLRYSSFLTLEISLCGSIMDAHADENTGIGFTMFSAFVAQEGGTSKMVLDVRQYSTLEQTIYHEVSHLIDSKLAYESRNNNAVMYSENGWERLNPDDFTYANRRVNLPESVYTDHYDSHFIDIYSRTFATEDRARIMEYAMMGTTGMFQGHEGRTEKLEYYCRSIRNAFDTTGWPALTKWEETLVAVGGKL